MSLVTLLNLPSLYGTLTPCPDFFDRFFWIGQSLKNTPSWPKVFIVTPSIFLNNGTIFNLSAAYSYRTLFRFLIFNHPLQQQVFYLLLVVLDPVEPMPPTISISIVVFCVTSPMEPIHLFLVVLSLFAFSRIFIPFRLLCPLTYIFFLIIQFFC